MKRAFWACGIVLWTVGLPAFAQGQRPATPAPRIATWLDPNRQTLAGMTYQTFHSRTINGSVSYLIYLPPGYETARNKRYPVVYWLHGLAGNQRTCAVFVERVDAAIKAGKAPEMIVVGVNGAGPSRYTDSFDGKRPVESVIIKDLLPHIDQTHRTIARREARAVEGQSMGGQGAAYLGFKYPELFGVVSMVGAAAHDADSVAGSGDPKEWNVIVPSERRKALFEEVYGGNVEYFQACNAWTVLEKNADAIRGKTVIRILVGDRDPLLGPNRRFHELLDRLRIPHTFHVVAGAPHNFGQVYDKLGSNPLQFYSDAFSDGTPAGKSAAASNTFSDWAEDFSLGMDHWWSEGGQRVWVEQERLHVWADAPEQPGGGVATVWCRRPLPADFELELEAHVVASTIQANNINLFFCYTDPAGRALEETRDQRRTAAYNLYHQLNGYIVTFLNDEGKARSRLRRNPGFALLAERHEGECRAGITYRLKVRKQNGVIVFSVDGRELLRATDPAPWNGGLFGLRTFRTQLWWDNVRVKELAREK